MSRSPEARKRRNAVWRENQKRLGAARRAAHDLTTAAAERRVVKLADGRTGRLLSVPAQSSVRSVGAKARVQLASGAVISVAPKDLTVCFDLKTDPRRPAASLHFLLRIRG